MAMLPPRPHSPCQVWVLSAGVHGRYYYPCQPPSVLTAICLGTSDVCPSCGPAVLSQGAWQWSHPVVGWAAHSGSPGPEGKAFRGDITASLRQHAWLSCPHPPHNRAAQPSLCSLLAGVAVGPLLFCVFTSQKPLGHSSGPPQAQPRLCDSLGSRRGEHEAEVNPSPGRAQCAGSEALEARQARQKGVWGQAGVRGSRAGGQAHQSGPCPPTAVP